MRELKTRDLFPMSRIIKKMGLKFAVEGKTQEQLGAEIIWGLIENLGVAEQEVLAFIASLKDTTAEAIADQSFGQTLQDFKELIGKHGFADFFKQAGGLTQ